MTCTKGFCNGDGLAERESDRTWWRCPCEIGTAKYGPDAEPKDRLPLLPTGAPEKKHLSGRELAAGEKDE